MKRRLIYTTLVALILVLSLSLSSCIYLGYQGEDIDLFTTAANNVFGIYGSASNGEATYSPTIRVIEKDDYGRVLFFYNEIGARYWESHIDYGMAFVIMQYSDSERAYYYRDECYMHYFTDLRDTDEVLASLDTSILEELKERNDWGKEIDADKCTSSAFNKYKEELEGYKDGEISNFVAAALSDYLGIEINYYTNPIYCHSDSYGRKLFYSYAAKGKDVNGDYIYANFAVILNADMSFTSGCVAEIEDRLLTNQVVSDLKASVGWDEP